LKSLSLKSRGPWPFLLSPLTSQVSFTSSIISHFLSFRPPGEISLYGAWYLVYLAAKAGDRRSRLFFERQYLKRRFRPSQAMVLFIRVYSTEVMTEYQVTNQKRPNKPLKIRPSAIKPIDIVLRRSAGSGFFDRLSKMSLAATMYLRRLYANHFFRL
jgi:hypothetical protein